MLVSDKAATEVFDSYLAGRPKKGSIFVECSTIFPDMAEEMSKKAKDHGVTVLTGCVFGRPDAAKNGSLLCVIAGDPAAKEKVKPAACFWDSLGQRLVSALIFCSLYTCLSTSES